MGITTKLESEFVICMSTHLSAFSILLDPYNILYDNEHWHSSQHEFWLTNISIIGSWITIFFITLVLIINYRKYVLTRQKSYKQWYARGDKSTFLNFTEVQKTLSCYKAFSGSKYINSILKYLFSTMVVFWDFFGT